MKKLKVVAFILLIASVVLSISCMPVMAVDYDPITNPGGFKPGGSIDGTLSEKIGTLLGVIQIIGIAVAVIVLMVLGLKYMLGSVEEKAVNKKAMIPYLVGALMVFSLTTIPNFIYQVSEGLFGSSTTCSHSWVWEDTATYKSPIKHIRDKVCSNCGERSSITEEHTRPATIDGSFGECIYCGR